MNETNTTIISPVKNIAFCIPTPSTLLTFYAKQYINSDSVPRDHFPTLMHSQLCRPRLNISSDNSWKDKSSPDQDNSRKIISVRQLMFNMGSLSTDMKCQPPLAVFLALKLHSRMRSKKWVIFLQEFHLIVAYNIFLSNEACFARSIGTKARANGDIVCPTNIPRDISQLTRLILRYDHNPSSSTHTMTYVPPVCRSLFTKPLTVYNRGQQESMNAVHDTLRTKAGDESLLPVMWSLGPK